MKFIDVVEWQPQSNDIFAWRFPEENLSTAAQVIVRESQEAVFFSKGQILDKLGPGKHTLSTENLPLSVKKILSLLKSGSLTRQPRSLSTGKQRQCVLWILITDR